MEMTNDKKQVYMFLGECLYINLPKEGVCITFIKSLITEFLSIVNNGKNISRTPIEIQDIYINKLNNKNHINLCIIKFKKSFRIRLESNLECSTSLKRLTAYNMCLEIQHFFKKNNIELLTDNLIANFLIKRMTYPYKLDKNYNPIKYTKEPLTSICKEGETLIVAYRNKKTDKELRLISEEFIKIINVNTRHLYSINTLCRGDSKKTLETILFLTLNRPLRMRRVITINGVNIINPKLTYISNLLTDNHFFITSKKFLKFLKEVYLNDTQILEA